MINNLLQGIKQLIGHIRRVMQPSPYYQNVHASAHLSDDAKVTSPAYLYMEEETSIPSGAVIMNGPRGKFIMKKWSFSSVDLLVICGNHMPVVGMPLIRVRDDLKNQLDLNSNYSKDVIVDEDVWIGARVTLLQGAHLERGCIVAAGAVVTGKVPAYSIFGGVPAHFIRWKWSIDEILEHESQVYTEEERFSKAELESQRKKYEDK